VIVSVKELEIDESRNRASLSGRDVPLRPLDLRLLALLARLTDRAVTREALSAALWGPDSDVDERAIDACVTRIRRALDGAGDCIVTVRRIGYRLDPDRLT
jgi:DNA-binding response OmpR family regulator